jgi:hypothetical protein
VTDKDGGADTDALELTVEFLGVEIATKPGGTPNPVSLKGGGVIPVAVLSSTDFDATAIDPGTLTLGDGADPDTPVAQRNNGTLMAEVDDVNEDGLPDLLVHFRVPALVANGDLTPATISLMLRGFLEDGCTNILGEDEVTVVP